ncbi:MAG: hypothetical protein J5J00_09680 [Deltaproteobacteria bacterium]|nr:hypothetical protein [Deltaproteobacteria bacterium]
MPNDFGPIYTETLLGRFPVEPWNTVSNLIFFFVVVYFSRRVYRERLASPIFLLGLPILFVGFIGGSLFHATRSDRIWLYLDFVPILLLTLLASLYFWHQVTGRLCLAAFAVIGPFVAFRLLRAALPMTIGLRISLGYSFLAITVLLPAILFCWKHLPSKAPLLAYSAASFLIAITFRMSDGSGLLPMGTHFLWHIFGGLSSFFLMSFLLSAELHRLKNATV